MDRTIPPAVTLLREEGGPRKATLIYGPITINRTGFGTPKPTLTVGGTALFVRPAATRAGIQNGLAGIPFDTRMQHC